MALAFDCSNYTGELNPSALQQAWEYGYKKAIVQIVDPDESRYPKSVWRQQIKALLDAGFEVEAYVYLWWEADCAGIVKDACEKLKDFPEVKMLWLDCEDTADGGFWIYQLLAAVKASSMPIGIYTGQWWWEGAGNYQGVNHLPLWIADYDGKHNLGSPTFGGWAHAVMKQFAGDTSLPGIPNIDLNYYDETKNYPSMADWSRLAAFTSAGAYASEVDVQPIQSSPRGSNWYRIVADLHN